MRKDEVTAGFWLPLKFFEMRLSNCPLPAPSTSCASPSLNANTDYIDTRPRSMHSGLALCGVDDVPSVR